MFKPSWARTQCFGLRSPVGFAAPGPSGQSAAQAGAASEATQKSATAWA